MSKEIYLDFNSFMGKQDEELKEIRKKIANYQKLISSSTNTTTTEREIDRDIRKLKDTQNELENAYSNRNAPSTIPGIELDRRQKEIQKFGISIRDIENTFKNFQNQKYSFKGGNINDNYQQSDEMKNMSNSELLIFQKEKIKEQDKIIDDITLDVKKGRVLAKEAKNIMEQQNKELDQLQEEIERVDSRFQRGIKRFENYVQKQSGCCIIIILIIELAIALLIFFILG